MWKLKKNCIPPMTDPMGQHWTQPNPRNILVDDTPAIMSMQDFDRLLEYSYTAPSGRYPGKMWKAQNPGPIWWLMWFGWDERISQAAPDCFRALRIHSRRIHVD